MPLYKKLLLATSVSLATTTSVLASSAQYNFTYDGYNYTVEVRSDNWQNWGTVASDTPWYGDSTLALALAEQIDPLVTETMGDSLGNAYSMPAVVWSSSGFCSYFTFGSQYACHNANLGSPLTTNYIWGTRVPDISISDLQPSILSTGLSINGLMLQTGTMVNGAHSRPFSHRVAAGEKTFWVAGDWGRDKHNSKDNQVGLAEFSFGYNYDPMQVNVSLGYAGSNQKLINEGKAEHRAKHLMIEGLIPLNNDENIIATLSAYGQWGDLSTRRGFDNAGTIEYSTGDANTRSWGARARVDWLKALTIKTTALNPYIDLWHGKTHVDGYSETGGSLPVTYNSTSSNATDIRLGVNTQTPLSHNFDFIANIEAVHRYENNAGSISGTVDSLGSFRLAGSEYEQNWLKAGVGIEGQLGAGKLSMMLNRTSEGEMPSSWVAASYQMKF